MARFDWDNQFDSNLLRASSKTNSSLHPVYDKVRSQTDNIARRAKGFISAESKNAEAQVQSIKHSRWGSDYGGHGKHGWLTAKATAFALKSAHRYVTPTMEYDGHEIHGRVTINRSGSASLEYGGTDPVAEIGKGTGEYVVHPPYGFLRRAII